MAIKVLKISRIDIVEDDRGQPVIHAHAQDQEPASYVVKGKNLTPERIEEIKKFSGKLVVCPVQYGLYNGEPWVNFAPNGSFTVISDIETPKPSPAGLIPSVSSMK
jgi:hypothetical protein